MTWRCKENCKSECCGVVPLDKNTYEKNKHLIRVKIEKDYELPTGEIFLMTEDGLCVFLDRQKFRCMVYNDRPEVCRNYGTIPELPCAYIKINGNPRNPAQVKHTQRKINHQVDDWLRKKK